MISQPPRPEHRVTPPRPASAPAAERPSAPHVIHPEHGGTPDALAPISDTNRPPAQPSVVRPLGALGARNTKRGEESTVTPETPAASTSNPEPSDTPRTPSSASESPNPPRPGGPPGRPPKPPELPGPPAGDDGPEGPFEPFRNYNPSPKEARLTGTAVSSILSSTILRHQQFAHTTPEYSGGLRLTTYTDTGEISMAVTEDTMRVAHLRYADPGFEADRAIVHAHASDYRITPQGTGEEGVVVQREPTAVEADHFVGVSAATDFCPKEAPPADPDMPDVSTAVGFGESVKLMEALLAAEPTTVSMFELMVEHAKSLKAPAPTPAEEAVARDSVIDIADQLMQEHGLSVHDYQEPIEIKSNVPPEPIDYMPTQKPGDMAHVEYSGGLAITPDGQLAPFARVSSLAPANELEDAHYRAQIEAMGASIPPAQRLMINTVFAIHVVNDCPIVQTVERIYSGTNPDDATQIAESTSRPRIARVIDGVLMRHLIHTPRYGPEFYRRQRQYQERQQNN